MRCGNPFNAPVPTAVPCRRCSPQQAGRAGTRNLPPATTLAENQPSPRRSRRLGLGTWARSGRGERGRVGGRAGDTISLPAPQRQSDATGLSRCQKGLFRGSPRSPRRHLPFPEPPSPNLLGTGNWANKSSLGRREGKAGKRRAGSAAPSLFPRLSEPGGGGGEAALGCSHGSRSGEEGKGTLSASYGAALELLWVCLETQSACTSVFTPGPTPGPRGASRALGSLLHSLLMEGFAGSG